VTELEARERISEAHKVLENVYDSIYAADLHIHPEDYAFIEGYQEDLETMRLALVQIENALSEWNPKEG